MTLRSRRGAAVLVDHTASPRLLDQALAGVASSGRPATLARAKERNDVDEQQQRH